jgi:hypothetical protein
VKNRFVCEPLKRKEGKMTHPITTGFDLEPLANDTVLIEFFGDDGKTFNTQIVTREVVEGMPAVIGLTLVCMDQGRSEEDYGERK